jgi:hypothetical protein
MAFDADIAIGVLEAQVTADPNLYGTTAQERNEFMEDARRRLKPTRTFDDHKEACKLAVETAKMILTISAGVLIAVGTFVQFSRTQGLAWISVPMFCFITSGLLLFFSMINGLRAMSGIYKRADGREAATALVWDTGAVKGRLDWQAYAGGLGLFALVAGLIVWAALGTSLQAAVSVTMSGTQSPLQQAGPITIEGTWTAMKLKTASNLEMNLPPGASPLSIICK